ncbi:MAG: hypothetical protein N2450_06125 [bacterium]|nr:hypothetical protein [bacterium]
MNVEFIKKVKELTPHWLRNLIQSKNSLVKYKIRINESENPYRHVTENLNNPRHYPFCIGIFRNIASYHKYYIAACEELQVPYKVLDLFSNDWLHIVKNSQCDVFLVWPDAMISIWNEVITERVKVLEQDLGLFVYPTYKEIYMYENKRRLSYWLTAHNYPTPQTWIFYNEDEAYDFAKKCPLPIVHKTNFGSSAKGIRILKTRNEVQSTIKKAFQSGHVPLGYDLRDKEWGTILFQEYLENVKEWRLVRVNESYFCREKFRIGDFHSGSGKVGWAFPPDGLLDITKEITDTFGFTSMNIDFFETKDGKFLINELHTVFGAILEKNLNLNDKYMGRWTFNSQTKTWEFEHGYFYQNACANLRIEYLIQFLLKTKRN